MAVHEEELPGIGRKYELASSKGERLDVVIHHSGRRDLYVFEPGSDDPLAYVQLTDDQARQLGAILGGVYFKPSVVEEIEAVIGELIVDWVTLDPESPSVGHSIGELEIRRKTGMSVIAIVREKEPLTSPPPDEVLRPDDRLVVVGPRNNLPDFIRLVVRVP